MSDNKNRIIDVQSKALHNMAKPALTADSFLFQNHSYRNLVLVQMFLVDFISTFTVLVL